MTDREPPRLADWLLRQFHFARRNPALTGDLLEMFRAGRSRAWYWRQTLAIVAWGVARNAWIFREYLGALSFGWLLQAAIVAMLASLRWPHPAHGIARLWAIAAVVLYLMMGIAICEVKTAMFGRTSWSLQLLSRYDWGARQNLGRLLALAAGWEFVSVLSAYFAVERMDRVAAGLLALGRVGAAGVGYRGRRPAARVLAGPPIIG